MTDITADYAATQINNKYKTNLSGRDLTHHSKPLMFPDTGGPFTTKGMVVGRAFTEYLIEAYVASDGKAVVFSNDKLLFVLDNFNFSDDIVAIFGR